MKTFDRVGGKGMTHTHLMIFSVYSISLIVIFTKQASDHTVSIIYCNYLLSKESINEIVYWTIVHGNVHSYYPFLNYRSEL